VEIGERNKKQWAVSSGQWAATPAREREMSRSSEESIAGSEGESAPDSRPSESGREADDTQGGQVRNTDTDGPERELPSRPEEERGESIEQE
jgi:hypothetical protein